MRLTHVRLRELIQEEIHAELEEGETWDKLKKWGGEKAAGAKQAIGDAWKDVSGPKPDTEGGYVTPGGSSGEYATREKSPKGRTQYDPHYSRLTSFSPDQVSLNQPVRPEVITDKEGELKASKYGDVGVPKKRDYIDFESSPSSWTPEGTYERMKGTSGEESAFAYVPAEKIPDDYLFRKGRKALDARNPKELRARLRGMSTADLTKIVTDREAAIDKNTQYGASGAAWGQTGQQRGKGEHGTTAFLDPAWSIARQHLEDRVSGGGASRTGERMPGRGGKEVDDYFADVKTQRAKKKAADISEALQPQSESLGLNEEITRWHKLAGLRD